jgi:hypothetical protein
MTDEFSTNQISERLISEIKSSIANKEYGSVEIYIEAGKVVQITERVIKKTNKLESRGPNYVYSRTVVK